jgi:hypothetical protein
MDPKYHALGREIPWLPCTSERTSERRNQYGSEVPCTSERSGSEVPCTSEREGDHLHDYLNDLSLFGQYREIGVGRFLARYREIESLP